MLLVHLEARGAQDLGGAAGKRTGETERTTHRDRVFDVLIRRERPYQAAHGAGPPAAVAGTDHEGENHALAVVDPRERHMQDAREAVAGAIVGMIAPGDVGQHHGSPAQALAPGLVFGEQGRDPLLELFPRRAETRFARGDLGGAGEQRIERLLAIGQLAVEPALAQAVGREHDLLRFGSGQQTLHHQRRDRQRAEARLRHARNLGERLGAHAHDELQERDRVATRQLVLVDDVQRVIVLSHVHVREGAPGAAHGIERPSLDRVEPFDARDRLVDVRARPWRCCRPPSP